MVLAVAIGGYGYGRQASVVFCGESPDLLVDCVDVGDSFSVAIASILLHFCRNVF